MNDALTIADATMATEARARLSENRAELFAVQERHELATIQYATLLAAAQLGNEPAKGSLDTARRKAQLLSEEAETLRLVITSLQAAVDDWDARERKQAVAEHGERIEEIKAYGRDLEVKYAKLVAGTIRTFKELIQLRDEYVDHRTAIAQAVGGLPDHEIPYADAPRSPVGLVFFQPEILENPDNVLRRWRGERIEPFRRPSEDVGSRIVPLWWGQPGDTPFTVIDSTYPTGA